MFPDAGALCSSCAAPSAASFSTPPSTSPLLGDAFALEDARRSSTREGAILGLRGRSRIPSRRQLEAASRRPGGFAGSSFVAVQRWIHDLARFRSRSQAHRDAVIGRRLDTNEEIADTPASAHVKRAAQESFDPPAFMLRRSMPWAGAHEHGLEFIAFGESLDRYERVLRRMLGLDDGIVDALFSFSRPLRGSYYWCPPVARSSICPRWGSEVANAPEPACGSSRCTLALSHSQSHQAIPVPLRAAERVRRVIAAPLLAAVVWRASPRFGGTLLGASMLGAFLFGFINHYVLDSSDNVARIPATDWGGAFTLSAHALAVLELGGVAAASWLLRSSARRWLAVSGPAPASRGRLEDSRHGECFLKPASRSARRTDAG
jgi:hypothetical protein